MSRTLLDGPALLPAQAPTEEPDSADFALPTAGLSDGQRLRALDRLDGYLTRKRRNLLGYQATQEMGGCAFDLGRFMQHNINNLGDPFQSGGYKPNTKVVERAVLDYYAALWHANGPHDPADPESYWGYVLSMGSTEGNMYALWNARDYLTGKELIQPSTSSLPPAPVNPNSRHPVAFYSEDTHYSFAKAVRVLGVDTFHAVGTEQYPGECPLDRDWPTEVPSRSGPSGHSWDGTGEIDIDALVVLVEFFAAKGHPIFISLNLGSTFKGAHDDVRTACERLLPVFERHGLIQGQVTHGRDPHTGEPLTDLRRRFWIHVDGALGAGYAPFVRMATADPTHGWTPDTDLPEFDFGLTLPTREHGDLDMVSSIAMSGHKWPGAPWPCGIYMTKVKYQITPPSQPDYTGAPDTTFAAHATASPPDPLGPPLPPLPPGPDRPHPPSPTPRRLPGTPTPRPGALPQPHPLARPHPGRHHRPLPHPQPRPGREVVPLLPGRPHHPRRRIHPPQLRPRLPDVLRRPPQARRPPPRPGPRPGHPRRRVRGRLTDRPQSPPNCPDLPGTRIM
ncbi:hypothetical protein ACFQ0T_23040 [Kitasatospora gansuensis]